MGMLSRVPVPTIVQIAQEEGVAKSGAHHTSVAQTIGTILDAAADKPYMVQVGPGLYHEPPFTIPPYVTVVGSGPYATILQTTDDLAHFVSGSPNAELDNVSIVGPTNAGFSGIDYQGVGLDPFKVFNIEIASGAIGIWCHPATSGIMLCDEAFNYSQGLVGTFMYASAAAILRGVICAYRDDANKGNTYGFRCEGPLAQLYLDNCIYKDSAGTYGVYLDHGGVIRLSAMNVSAGTNGLFVGPNAGPGGEHSRMECLGGVIRTAVTNHIVVQSAVAEVQFSGTAQASKVTALPGTLTASIADPSGGTYTGTVNIGEFYLGDGLGNTVPVKDWLQFTASTGLAEGGEVTRIAGAPNALKLHVAAGEGFISLSGTTGLLEHYWDPIDITLADDSTLWVIVDSAGTVTSTSGTPDPLTSLTLAQAVTRGGAIVFLGIGTETELYQGLVRQQIYRFQGNGPRAVSGIATTAHATPLKLSLDGGSFYIGGNLQTVGVGTAVTFTTWYRNSTAGYPWVAVPGQTLVNDAQYNDVATAGGLKAIPGGSKAGHVTYIASTEAGAEYHVVLGSMVDAAVANLTVPTPPDWLKYAAARSGQVVVNNSGAILQINDARQFGSAQTMPTSGVTAHALLSGLTVGDDHTQYQLRTEKGAVSGYCGLTAGQKVPATNVPFTATAPPDVTAGLASVGAGTEVARQNHVHFHGNLAAVDGALGALHSNAVAGVTPGFISAANQTKLDGLAINHAARHALLQPDALSPTAIGAYTIAESDARDLLRQGGLLADPTWTDHHDGTVTVDALTAVLFADPAFGGHPEQYTIPAVLHTPTDHNRSYVVADYNGGGPGIPAQKVIDNVSLINESTVIPVVTIWREGNDLEVLTWDSCGKGLANKIHQRLVKVSRFERESGFALSELAVRRVIIGHGVAWYGATSASPADFDSSNIAQSLVLCHHVGGAWTYSAITQYDNLQYDDGVGLLPVSVGHYAVNWVYRDLGTNDRAYILLGSGDYTDVQAHDSQPPTAPPGLVSTALLVGRIIVLRGDPTAHTISSAFETTFAGTPIQFHNDLAGLNDGDYVHLTAAAHADLTDGGETTLHAHPAAIGAVSPGFISAADQTKLNGVATGATNTPLAATNPANVTRSAADPGAGATASKVDHKHDVSTAAPGTVTFLALANEGAATTLARSDHSHALTLPAAPADVTKAVANAGASANVAREDHKHDVDTAAPSTIGTGNVEGNATSLARSNHVHDHGAQTVDTQHALAVAATSHGFMDKADKTKLNGIASGATNTPLSDTAPLNVTKAAADQGTAANAARRDHKHDVDTAAPSTIGTGNVEGNATSLARSNHVHDHGNQSTGAHHAVAIAGGANGFLSGTDKTRIDATTYNLFVQTATVSVTANGAEQTLVGAGAGSATLPANFFSVGKDLRIKAHGYWTRAAGNLRIRVYLGGTLVLDTGASNPGSSTNQGWDLEANCTGRTTGAPGPVMCQGRLNLATSATAGVTWTPVNTAATAVTTTGTLAVDITCLWSGNGDTFACTNLILTSMN